MPRIKYLSLSLLTCFFICFVLIQSIVHAESLTYSVLKGNTPIGRIHIDRTKINDITEYFFESNVKLTFIISIEVYDRMKVVFKGAQMLQAELYRTLNGKVRVNNYSTWNGKFYSMTNKDNENTFFKQLISLTTANLYYTEPVNISSVFSENFQKMIPIKHAGIRRYLLDLPNGNKTYYSYTNGICSLVEAETDWATLKFVLNK